MGQWTPYERHQHLAVRICRHHHHHHREVRDRVHSAFLALFCSAARVLVTGSEDATVKVWCLQTGNCIATLEGDSVHTVFIALRFAADDDEFPR